jgi:molybdenum transport protein
MERAEIARLIAEDAGSGDLTTEALGIGRRSGRMTFHARGPMVLAGAGIACGMMEGLDVAPEARDGDALEAGAPILAATGPVAALHRSWKAGQTLVEILSGIASATRQLVDAAAAVDPAIRVATTRKTFPGVRHLSQLAVKAGGGILHRQGLGETILVFAEHRAFLADWTLSDIAAHLRRAQPEKALGIEVADVREALAAADAGFDLIQLEKFLPADVAEVRARVRRSGHWPVIAAAGGISPENVADYVRAGAGLIVTSWPYTARPRDVSVRITPQDYA